MPVPPCAQTVSTAGAVLRCASLPSPLTISHSSPSIPRPVSTAEICPFSCAKGALISFRPSFAVQ